MPELNTTSTADISFMLLIFFLVASSVSIDKGLQRMLPPIDNASEPVVAQVEREHALAITITAQNQCLVEKEPVQVGQLHAVVGKFLLEQGSEHVIVVDSDPTARYETYFAIQNQLAAAYQEARHQLARNIYGQDFDQLNASQQQAIRQQCPQHIAEVSNPTPEL